MRMENKSGFVAAEILLLTALMATMGIAMLEVRNGTLRDFSGITLGGQAKFYAQSGLQEAKYYVTKIDGNWTGASQERVNSSGANSGSYDYTVSKNGINYSVVANGYVPNRTAKNAVKRTLNGNFSYFYIAVGSVVLDPSASGAISASGNAIYKIYGGKLYINSVASTAGSASGNATIDASEIDVVGSTSGNFIGTVKSGLSAVPDPLLNLPIPDSAGLIQQSASVLNVTDTRTLNPGVYVGGISCSANAVVTLNPGIYYMKTGASGKGFTVSGNATITGNGVMIFNEGIDSSEVIHLSGNGSITLTPPTSGVYKSIMFFQSRTSTNAMTLSGNSQTKIRGNIYLKGGTLSVSGNGSNAGSLHVANRITVSGNGTVSLNNF